MGLSDASKRTVLGRALSSDRISETLLPKRIVLPVMVISVPWQLESSESSLENVFEDEAQRDS